MWFIDLVLITNLLLSILLLHANDLILFITKNIIK